MVCPEQGKSVLNPGKVVLGDPAFARISVDRNTAPRTMKIYAEDSSLLRRPLARTPRWERLFRSAREPRPLDIVIGTLVTNPLEEYNTEGANASQLPQFPLIRTRTL